MEYFVTIGLKTFHTYLQTQLVLTLVERDDYYLLIKFLLSTFNVIYRPTDTFDIGNYLLGRKITEFVSATDT